MTRLLLSFGLVMSVLSSAWGQNTSDYLALRKKNKIKQAASVDAIDVVVGSKVLEVRGMVKGSFEVDGRKSILLERTDGETDIVDADTIPEWLLGREIQARLIVKVIRPKETDTVAIFLLAAAPEAEISKYDPVVKAPSKSSRNSRSVSGGSKSGAPLSGPIGRSGGRVPNPVVSSGSSTIRGVSDWLVQRYASFVKSQNRRLSDGECMKIANGVLGYSVRYGVDPRLIMAILFCESGFDPTSTSHTGAKGLGQLMPDTARELGVNNAYDTNQNLYGTVKLIRGHLDKYDSQGGGLQSLSLALAAYNAGPGAVKRHGGIPPYRETQRYVQKVVAVYRQLCRND